MQLLGTASQGVGEAAKSHDAGRAGDAEDDHPAQLQEEIALVGVELDDQRRQDQGGARRRHHQPPLAVNDARGQGEKARDPGQAGRPAHAAAGVERGPEHDQHGRARGQADSQRKSSPI